MCGQADESLGSPHSRIAKAKHLLAQDAGARYKRALAVLDHIEPLRRDRPLGVLANGELAQSSSSIGALRWRFWFQAL